MNIEVTIFILRLIAGLSLAGFLLALFVVIWRNAGAADQLPAAAGFEHGHLTCEQPAPADEAQRYSLRPILTMGRAEANMIVISDDYASAKHARIVLEQGRWWLEDRGSRNGTQLNGETIASRAILAAGDEIGIGKYRYRLHLNREYTAL